MHRTIQTRWNLAAISPSQPKDGEMMIGSKMEKSVGNQRTMGEAPSLVAEMQ
jgi:hypothetical protein